MKTRFFFGPPEPVGQPSLFAAAAGEECTTLAEAVAPAAAGAAATVAAAAASGGVAGNGSGGAAAFDRSLGAAAAAASTPSISGASGGGGGGAGSAPAPGASVFGPNDDWVPDVQPPDAFSQMLQAHHAMQVACKSLFASRWCLLLECCLISGTCTVQRSLHVPWW